MRNDFDSEWDGLFGEVHAGMKAWRLAHPRATFKEMERELEARLAAAKAHMLGDLAQASAAADVAHATGERPTCPRCGGRLRAKGKRTRRLTGPHDQSVELARSYLECPQCGFQLFPPG